VNQLSSYRAHLEALDSKKPVIVCGDLNVAHKEIDLANPKTNKKSAGFTKEERESEYWDFLSYTVKLDYNELYGQRKSVRYNRESIITMDIYVVTRTRKVELNSFKPWSFQPS